MWDGVIMWENHIKEAMILRQTKTSGRKPGIRNWMRWVEARRDPDNIMHFQEKCACKTHKLSKLTLHTCFTIMFYNFHNSFIYQRSNWLAQHRGYTVWATAHALLTVSQGPDKRKELSHEQTTMWSIGEGVISPHIEKGYVHQHSHTAHTSWDPAAWQQNNCTVEQKCMIDMSVAWTVWMKEIAWQTNLFVTDQMKQSPFQPLQATVLSISALLEHTATPKAFSSRKRECVHTHLTACSWNIFVLHILPLKLSQLENQKT